MTKSERRAFELARPLTPEQHYSVHGETITVEAYQRALDEYKASETRIVRTKIVKDREWCEYVVKAWTVWGRRPEADYFTSDRDDAKDTAALMV